VGLRLGHDWPGYHSGPKPLTPSQKQVERREPFWSWQPFSFSYFGVFSARRLNRVDVYSDHGSAGLIRRFALKRRPAGKNALGLEILSMVGFASNWFRSTSAFSLSGDALPEQQHCATRGNYFQ
jgi:hypothetical protein